MPKYKIEYFDLETAPQPPEILRPMMPEFDAPKGWKDQAKIDKVIQEKRVAWMDQAALSPLTGQILAGVWVDMRGEVTIYDADEIGEHDLICHIFARFKDAGMGAHYKVSGFNIGDFDVPWLVRRAWANHIRIPPGLLKLARKWFDLAPWMIDIRHIWGLGETHAKGDLARLAAFLGVGEKTGSGKDFHKNWRNPVMHAEAEAYLINDGLILPKIMEFLLSLSDDQYGLNLQVLNQPKPPTE